MDNNMPLSITELSKMNAFECLWNCSKDHLSDVAIMYGVDLEINTIQKIKKKIDQGINLSDKERKVFQNIKLLRKTYNHSITYGDLISNILKTYNSLKSFGVKRGDVITFSSITTPELIYTIYASILLGSIIKPIDVRFNSEELLNELNSTPSKLFFGAEPFLNNIIPIIGDLKADQIVICNFKESLPKLFQIGEKIQINTDRNKKNKASISWNEFINNGFGIKNIPNNNVKCDDPIHLTSTTGTTGKSKMLLHNSNNWNAQLYNASYCGLNFKRKEYLFNCTVPWVDFGIINVIHTFLCNGIIMKIDPTWTSDVNAEYIIKNNPEWWLGAPGWLDDLFTNSRYEQNKIPNAKYFITGGSALYPNKHLIYQKRLSEMSKQGIIAPGYGFSEGSAAISLDIENKEKTIGKMWPLIEAQIRDKSGNVLPNNCEGELWITSNNNELSQIAMGYVNNPLANNENFRYDDFGRKWARSGDKVINNGDGSYSWISRYKNILTFNGYNIDCEKISEEAEKIEGINKTVVIGCITSEGNQMPVLCVELANDFKDEKEQIKEAIKLMMKKFPEYYKLKDIVFYEKLPLISMKIDIQCIKKQLLDENGEYTLKRKKI